MSFQQSYFNETADPIAPPEQYNYTVPTTPEDEGDNFVPDYNIAPPHREEWYESEVVKQTVQLIMDQYDANKDGKLDQSEVEKMLDEAMNYKWINTEMKVKEVKTWFDKYDQNKDGLLSIKELADALMTISWR